MAPLTKSLQYLPKRMAMRLFLLSWFITLMTLGMFVIAIIPEQMRDLEDALRSKAQGISSSLQDVTAGAAISEDYSSVVDQCVQVLAGDNAIDYLVVTKNDGLSVIVERSGWRTEKLNGFWTPETRKLRTAITQVPFFNRRVYSFSRPFDYSAIEWGWIHVGLSLSLYEKSVSTVYWRTLLLAVLGVALSFLASITYARRQVRPIRELQSVVQQVAGGDLLARAAIRSGDEVEDLAGAFNTMADSIMQRNQILVSIRFAAQEFLGASDWRSVIESVLAKTGMALQATHGILFEAEPRADGQPCAVIQAIWTAERAEPLEQQTGDRIMPGEAAWARQLCANQIVMLTAGRSGVGNHSALLVPIHAGQSCFGFLEFCDDNINRQWTEAETDGLRAVAGMMGASIARQQVQEDVVEAKQNLEVRVLERTRELQMQVLAKERAHADLAEAQQRLIKLSRLSGMAEVATGVLHNVGNVLNSVNVSSTIVATRIREMRVDNLSESIELLDRNRTDIARFVSQDPKGMRLLPYLRKLTRHFKEERMVLLGELDLLRDHIGHIKEIVATQQNYAKVSGLIEDVHLASLAEDAFRIIHSGIERHVIKIVREFEDVPPVPADKHKILQILLNLLRNAQQSIKQSDNPERTIRVGIRRQGENRVRVEVRDTGIGLDREDLTRIFAHGFTTKPDGHGFGLHSGALAAKDMGGSLHAESEGPGKGATFVLELQMGKALDKRNVA